MKVVSTHDVYKDRVCGLCGCSLTLEEVDAHEHSSFDRFKVKHGGAARVHNHKSTVVADWIEKYIGEPYPRDLNSPPFICASCRNDLFRVAEKGENIVLKKDIPFDHDYGAKHLNIRAAKISLLTEEELDSLSECPTAFSLKFL